MSDELRLMSVDWRVGHMLNGSYHLLFAGCQKLLIESLRFAMSADPSFVIRTASDDPNEVFRYVRDHEPNLVLLDMDNSGAEILNIAENLHQRFPKTRCLLLCDHLSDIELSQIVKMRTVSCVSTSESVESLHDLIQRAARGEVCYSVEIRDRLKVNEQTDQYEVRQATELAKLTTRQLQVLRLLALGFSVKDVASRMHLSEKSIDSHKYRIMNRLKIHDRVALARYAIREGLVTI
ncbi:response regulator transcription factor [Calycomorphotria hydatis]|uniref:Response regulator protein VraR n=1 Tax=Calycomorphotria hydatis TaxID=2528027 RepID=A0A517TF10_9PLAN|nr:response regulator transcription factor [Calycomorphotria hydatis]QDT66960.1 Response regulator protein VraR [Calycomorphotria hydatis]